MPRGRGGPPRQKGRSGGRDIHQHLLDRLNELRGARTWSALAEEADIPQSTLSNQVSRPRFSIDVVARLAYALEVPVAELFPSTLDRAG